MKQVEIKEPQNQRIWLLVFLVLFLYVIVLYVPQIIMGSMEIKAPLDDIINLIIYTIFWFWIVPFGMKVPRRVESLKVFLADIRLSKVKPFGLFLIGLLIGAIYLAILSVTSLLAGDFAPSFYRILPPGNWVLLYGNIGAIFEEIAIRGVILYLLLKKFDQNKAVLMSAVIFGVGHIITYFLGNELSFSLIQVGYAFSLGILFGGLVIKTNSLIPSIIAHMVINSFSQIFPNIESHFYLLLITTILTTILGLILIRYIPQKFISKIDG